MKQVAPDFEPLMEEVKKALALNPSVEQAIAAATEKGNIYCLVNHSLRDHRDGDTFIKMLKAAEDTVISRLVTMWQNGGLDVPPYHFAAQLVSLDSRNQDAAMLLLGVPRDDPQGEPRYVAKPLRVYTNRPKSAI